jgi:hypothetical protein
MLPRLRGVYLAISLNNFSHLIHRPVPNRTQTACSTCLAAVPHHLVEPRFNRSAVYRRSILPIPGAQQRREYAYAHCPMLMKVLTRIELVWRFINGVREG